MSGKGGRKNLGTVVECSETGDECNLPLLTTTNDSASTENENKEPIQEASISNEKHDSEQSKTVVVDSLILDEHVNQQLNRSREDLPRRDSSQKKSRSSVFAQSRLNFINFINNVSAPVRSTKNKNKSPTSNTPSSGSSHQQFAQSLSIESSLSRLEIQIRDDDGIFEDCGTSMAPSESESEKVKKIQCDSGTMFAHESVAASASNNLSKKMRDCPLCYFRQPQSCFPKLTNCSHRSCRTCLAKYLQVEIMESRVNISCPECSEPMHQNDIYTILTKMPGLIEKYENFSLRRILMTDPDTRWCPAPDCTYAVIATSCAACPQLKCERPGCNSLFCYHCKGMWHNNQTCDEARRERAARLPSAAEQGNSSSMPMNFLLDRDNFLKPGDVKACPRCKTLIVKMNDGSCNHMVCAMCGAEFCWLCLKVITDLHYLSPTGCTFWGKRPWTKKKKLLWQIGILIGAPVGIALIGGLAVPGIIFGVPVFIGRKAYQRFEHLSRGKRRLITAASVVGSLIVSPVLAVMAVGVGVPIMLAYVYGVVPLSLCRNGACGGAEAQQDENPYGTRDEEEEIAHLTSAYAQVANERARLLDRQDGTSVRTGFSINSGLSSEVTGPGGHRPSNAGTASCKIHVHDHSRRRPSIESGVTSLGEKFNFDGASVNAMAGSKYDQKSVHTVYSDGQEVYYDEAGSTKALAGSVLDSKSLTDSCGRHTATGSHIHREREMSPNSFDDQHKIEDNISNGSKGRPRLGDNVAIIRKKSKSSIISQQHVGPEDLQPAEFYCSESMPGPSLGRQSTSSDVEDGADPYKVHAIMDNLKQILNDDSADSDRLRKQGKNFKKNPNLVKIRQTRASSKNFGQPVAAQINENQALIVPVANASTIIQMPEEDARSHTSSSATSNIPHFSNSEEGSPKRSFFSRLFHRNKKSETK